MVLVSENPSHENAAEAFLADRPQQEDPLRKNINRYYRGDETDVVHSLQEKIHLTEESRRRIQQRASGFVTAIRQHRKARGTLDAFMHEYDLSSEEGIMLMCLSEAFLRIPDAETADKLIADNIGSADWEKHLGKSDSVFVNASTWALMLTGQVVSSQDYTDKPLHTALKKLSEKMGEPLIRKSVLQGMRIIAGQFVLGRTIDEALDRARVREQQGYSYSFDMLGEAAHTAEDAQHYFQAYRAAIEKIGSTASGQRVKERPSISIKISALHPRYEISQHKRIKHELLPQLIALAQLAMEVNIGLTIDAEESDRLDLSLDILECLMSESSLASWRGLGLAVQAYQKRAFAVIEWLEQLVIEEQRHLMIRLVKGAYWDTEIKRAQQAGVDGYPVYTRKVNTDVAYLACAQRLFAANDFIYPQFASHNAHTVAAIIEMAGNRRDFEFQRLHGMGAALYEQLLSEDESLHCRIYAPVGSHADLLPYLVRRLLENGSNTSFINRIIDGHLPVEEVIKDPHIIVGKLDTIPHPRIPLPADLYQPQRLNARGYDLSDLEQLHILQQKMTNAFQEGYRAVPVVAGRNATGRSEPVFNPANHTASPGSVIQSNQEDITTAVKAAASTAVEWDGVSVEHRAEMLLRIADLYEQHAPALMALVVRETGKTMSDAVAEIRESVDFCRYYAACSGQNFAAVQKLSGPTGESNSLHLHGRGVFACISPWNFPLAIFTGQVTAALVTGNTVIAKPAEQSPLVAHLAVTLMHQAGIPPEVLQLLPGDGPTVGGTLIMQPEVQGVVFTGSFETAKKLQQNLASRAGAIIPLIAETGGLNAMIVDSSALTEQVVSDVLASAFQSAGQRCSALRVLYLQEEIAEKTIHILSGAMQELQIGDPALLATDIGPVIDAEALSMIEDHYRDMQQQGRFIYQCGLPENCRDGYYFAPCMFEINDLEQLQGETFGPFLHIIRFSANAQDAVINSINESGYGLTLGIHSRINSTIKYLTTKLKIGNIYVNRNQIGAMVGVQPFGGEGLSGTGPKAGGPHYLQRFITERVITINTTAQGGNVNLLTLQE